MPTSPFLNLFNEIKSKIGYLDATPYKNEYRDIIDSYRTLSEINTIKDLLETLLDRDAFWEKNIDVLENVVKRMSHSNQNRGEGLLGAISTYKKLEINNAPSHCDICKVPVNWDRLLQVQHLSLAEPSAPEAETEDLDEEQEFNLIVLYLSERLANDWRKLATCLRLERGLIETIASDEKSTSAMVERMLQTWRKQNGNMATKEVLITKLNTRHVLRRDLVEAIVKGKHK